MSPEPPPEPGRPQPLLPEPRRPEPLLPGPLPPGPLLNVDRLVKRFGGFRALDGVSFHLHPGEVLGLVGPNGSGKTTCINVICGLYPADGGSVTYNGRPIAGAKSHRLVKAGINRTFQSPRPFLSLTVRENVEVAAHYGEPKPGFDIDALLALLELDRYAHRPAAELNSAQQKTLDLARAMATEPRLLLVDELAAGLNPAELSRMADRLRALANAGMALLVVEHLMGFIDKVTDRVVVMAAGKEFFGGTLSDATRDPEVIRVFLGGAHHA
ncbi:ABC transporter ATP-binding protein [Rhodopila sp.]|uniref:ABC transporter ATP-binding protein n=1 Tax=Rhodopila sp. TaxID=2480087 RepID=UPI003D0F6CAD